MLVLRNCRLVGALTEDVSLDSADILIRAGLIASIDPCGARYDGEFTELDINGATVLPGLIDAHVHLHYTRPTQPDSFFVDPCTRSFDVLTYAQYLLSLGITTVRDCGDDMYYPSVAVRNAIAQGIVTGPRILCCGLTLNPTECGTESYTNMMFIVDSAEDARKGVRTNWQKGADFIKLYGSGSMMTVGAEPGMLIMEEDEIRAAVQAAKRRGIYCAIHAHGEEAIDVAVRSGVRTIEHASFITEETLCYMDGRDDCGIVPTLFVTSDLLSGHGDSADMSAAAYQKVSSCVDHIRSSLRNAYKNHDVLIGWGTDTRMSSYKATPCMEFKMRKEFLGCDNIDILKQATINSARLIRVDDKVGTVKVGKCADLIIVNGDPVADIECMYTPPAGVIKGGAVIR